MCPGVEFQFTRFFRCIFICLDGHTTMLITKTGAWLITKSAAKMAATARIQLDFVLVLLYLSYLSYVSSALGIL